MSNAATSFTNKGQQYAVIHIPKTAGTSLHAMMADAFGQSTVSPTFAAFPFNESQRERYTHYRVIFGHISYDDVAIYFPQRQLISFFREPVERCLSWYHFVLKQPLEHPTPLNELRFVNDASEAVALAQQVPLEELLQAKHPHVEQNLRNRQTWQLGAHACIEERKLSQDEVLEQALSHLDSLDFVGTQERFSQEAFRLFEWLGFEKMPSVRTENRSRSKSFRGIESKTALSLLEQMNDADIALYEAVLRRLG